MRVFMKAIIWRAIRLFSSLVFTSIVSSTAIAFGDVKVRTEAGEVAGSVEKDAVSFLGIPFAAPPVGALRWRAPQPVAPWRGVLSAKTFGKDCIQEPMKFAPEAGYLNPTSEDCLYLNIWRPVAETRSLPVMVWIHGGAFIMGAGSYPSYNGAQLARQGVVLVTVNYRLGRFGTFAHPALSREQAGQPLANYGLLDQIAALRWVQANIAAFGGDPRNVTIFGQSAGASSVNFLMTSPLARGLFAKAISESGGASSGLKPLAAAEADGKAWAEAVGVMRDDATVLRALPADTVLGAPVSMPAFPVIDGEIVTSSTDNAFRAGLALKVPYIVGANSYEESLARWLPGIQEKYVAGLGAAAPTLLRAYTSDGTPRERALGNLWGEANMVEPARFRAKYLAKSGAHVWFYHYSYVPEALRETTPGAGHDAEIEMVFRNPSVASQSGWTAGDDATARTVSGYWVNFARTGDPNGPGLKSWPAYSVSGGSALEFSNNGPNVVRNFGAERLDLIEAVNEARRHPQ